MSQPTCAPVAGAASKAAASILVLFSPVAGDARAVRRQHQPEFLSTAEDDSEAYRNACRPLKDPVEQIMQAFFDASDADLIVGS